MTDPLPASSIVERYVTRAQLAEFMAVSTKTIDKWVAAGCPSETWGLRARRFLPSEVKEWARQRTRDAA